jgi:cytochrome c oxidase subunit II
VPGGPGAQVFANYGCAGCHTLAEARAGGTVGPDLDESIADQSRGTIEESIVKPDAALAQGYPPNVMPSNYEQIIPRAELEALVGFLATAGRARPRP